MAWVDDLCPMTDEPAKRLTKTTGDFSEFICPSCKRFRISHSALETLKRQNRTRDERARSCGAGDEIGLQQAAVHIENTPPLGFVLPGPGWKLPLAAIERNHISWQTRTARRFGFGRTGRIDKFA